jgi:hypothetical protein
VKDRACCVEGSAVSHVNRGYKKGHHTPVPSGIGTENGRKISGPRRRKQYIHLIFIGPCIVIYSCSTTNRMSLLPQIIYSCKTLYIFRTVFPSIIRSSKLRIQQRYMSNSCCYLLLLGIRRNSSLIWSSSSCLTYTVAVYVVLSSWWWTERPSETCRAFYQNK